MAGKMYRILNLMEFVPNAVPVGGNHPVTETLAAISTAALLTVDHRSDRPGGRCEFERCTLVEAWPGANEFPQVNQQCARSLAFVWQEEGLWSRRSFPCRGPD